MFHRSGGGIGHAVRERVAERGGAKKVPRARPWFGSCQRLAPSLGDREHGDQAEQAKAHKVIDRREVIGGALHQIGCDQRRCAAESQQANPAGALRAARTRRPQPPQIKRTRRGKAGLTRCIIDATHRKRAADERWDVLLPPDALPLVISCPQYHRAPVVVAGSDLRVVDNGIVKVNKTCRLEHALFVKMACEVVARLNE